MTDFSLLGALIARHLRADEADPAWADRDRLVLCAEAAAALAGAPALTALATPVAGPAGLAFGAAAGMALAERLLAARFGRSLVDHRTWLLAGPAELASGTAHEAAAIAGALPLCRLVVVAALPASEAASLARFTALGWTVKRLASPCATAAETAIKAAQRALKPTAIVWLTDGAPADCTETLAAGAPPRGAGARRAWLKRLRRHAQSDSFNAALAGRLALPALLPPESDAAPLAEQVGAAVGRLGQTLPDLVVLPPATAGEAASTNGVSWAGRCQAAAAALLGVAAHGGLLPVGRFTLQEAETVRPALRAAAAMNLRGVYLVTEGAAACPVGGLRAAWRAMRNLLVLRPGDPAEAADCLGLALRRTGGPSLLLLSAGPVAAPRLPGAPARACARGGYKLIDLPQRDATLIAAGPELALAVAVQAALSAHGVHASVVSLPCWTLLAAQDAAYREAVLGTAPRFGLEAGTGSGWAQWLGETGLFLDTEGGKSAASLAAHILRRLGRQPAILDSVEHVLESAFAID